MNTVTGGTVYMNNPKLAVAVDTISFGNMQNNFPVLNTTGTLLLKLSNSGTLPEEYRNGSTLNYTGSGWSAQFSVTQVIGPTKYQITVLYVNSGD